MRESTPSSYCIECGEKLKATAHFCYACGTPVHRQSSSGGAPSSRPTEMATPRQSSSGSTLSSRPTEMATNELTNNRMALVGCCLGLASILLFGLGLVPLAAIVCSAIGLGTFKADTQKHRWMAGVGLALGILFMLVHAEIRGYIAFP